MDAKFYIVGGFVRDELLGVTSKDVDFAVEAESYDAMKQAIIDKGGEIFLENPEYLTIRGRLPNIGAADFVLCRKESDYTDGRRPDKVEMGTLADDLARRDFTVNAIAKDENGDYVDPYNGQRHLRLRILKCVGNAYDRLNEDPLRMLRAIRFSITKYFLIDVELADAMRNTDIQNKLLSSVSEERIREELVKCFQHDTSTTLTMLKSFDILDRLFSETNMKLLPTFKGK